MALLEVRGLVKDYGERRVVDGVSFEVDTAEIVGLLGPNGAGKTTSFRSTIGMITPDAGQVLFDGEDVTRMPMYQRARRGMGYLSQEPSIFRQLSVEQNVLAVLEMRGFARSERLRRCAELLDELGLARLAKQRADTLSGGERRRLEISRTLAIEPLLILLDEPFAGIDPKVVGELRRLLAQLRERGIGVLITDHNYRETLESTDRAYVITEGRVLKEGRPEELLNDREVRRHYLGGDDHEHDGACQLHGDSPCRHYLGAEEDTAEGPPDATRARPAAEGDDLADETDGTRDDAPPGGSRTPPRR